MERKRGNGRKKRVLHTQPEGSSRVASLNKQDREEKAGCDPLSWGRHHNGPEAAFGEEVLRFYFERSILLRLSSAHLPSTLASTQRHRWSRRPRSAVPGGTGVVWAGPQGSQSLHPEPGPAPVDP